MDTTEDSPLEVQTDGLWAIERERAQATLDTMVGQRVIAAEMQERGVVITTESGTQYIFYGWLGEQAGDLQDPEN